ncbi:hypothetical protein VTL71DRAFT_6916, partial [Oculimacula yallundae]
MVLELPPCERSQSEHQHTTIAGPVSFKSGMPPPPRSRETPRNDSIFEGVHSGKARAFRGLEGVVCVHISYPWITGGLWVYQGPETSNSTYYSLCFQTKPTSEAGDDTPKIFQP